MSLRSGPSGISSLKQLWFLSLLLLTAGVPAPLPIVEPNDNRVAAGVLRDGALTLDLVVTMARWYPENVGGSFTEVAVFAEVGKAPQIPAPLIRVPAGTKVKVRIRNGLADSTLTLFGLGITDDTGSGAVHVAPGESRTLAYDATTPGTYFYAARTSSPLSKFAPESEQLAGALVVDAPDDRTDDRILVLNIWGEVNMKDTSYRQALAINGKSWPYTERFEATVGDTLRWRVVNASLRDHPMHLHGAYFRVDALGLVDKDTLIAPELRPMVVTQAMMPRSTMRLTWSPDTPGNWLFHCHLVYHVASDARLDPPAHDEHGAMSHDPKVHMSGLINAIEVRPRPDAADDTRRSVRRLDLFAVQSGDSGDAARPRSRGFLLARGAGEPAAADLHGVSDLLVVTRGEPTDVTVHNRLDEATSVHWHGLELESWSDGVPGFSGQGTAVAPPVLPGGEFVARLTLKRAGTFIYHTHLNDIEQLVSGLYGPLVVLEPGERWDPTRDFVFTGGQNRYNAAALVVNGGDEDPPITMRVGESIRLRMIQIAAAVPLTYEIRRDGALAEWQASAKDGYDLSPMLATVRPAQQSLAVGETFDAVFTPRAPGRYEFRGVLGTGLRYKRMIVVE